MRRFGYAFAAALAAVIGCGGSDGVTETNVVDGIRYTARVASIASGGTQTWLNVIVTLTNVTSTEKVRTYPLGCPVRIRLYRPADGFKAYDETRLVCYDETLATITIPAGASRELVSGVRVPGTILGDSLQVTTYLVRAVPMTEGPTREVEIVAGSWTF